MRDSRKTKERREEERNLSWMVYKGKNVRIRRSRKENEEKKYWVCLKKALLVYDLKLKKS